MGISVIASPSSAANALFLKVRHRVLAVLFGSPDRSCYTNEAMGLAQSGAGAVQSDALAYGEAFAALEGASLSLGRTINPALYSATDFRARRTQTTRSSTA